MDALERAISPRTRLLLLCSPHNPGGPGMVPGRTGAIRRHHRSHGLVIGSDEIHSGLILDDDKPHIPTATLSPEIEARTVTLMAPARPSTSRARLLVRRHQQPPDPQGLLRSHGGNSAPRQPVRLRRRAGGVRKGRGMASGAACLSQGQPRSRGEGRSGRCRVSPSPTSKQLHAWIDARDMGNRRSGMFLRRVGGGTINGVEFGAPGYLRLNFGCPRSLLSEALNRMADALARHARL